MPDSMPNRITLKIPFLAKNKSAEKFMHSDPMGRVNFASFERHYYRDNWAPPQVELFIGYKSIFLEFLILALKP